MAQHLLIISAVTSVFPQMVKPEEFIPKLSEEDRRVIAGQIGVFRYVAVVEGHVVGDVQNWNIRVFERSGSSGEALVLGGNLKRSRDDIIPTLAIGIPNALVLIEDRVAAVFEGWCHQAGISTAHFSFDGAQLRMRA